MIRNSTNKKNVDLLGKIFHQKPKRLLPDFHKIFAMEDFLSSQLAAFACGGREMQSRYQQVLWNPPPNAIWSWKHGAFNRPGPTASVLVQKIQDLCAEKYPVRCRSQRPSLAGSSLVGQLCRQLYLLAPGATFPLPAELVERIDASFADPRDGAPYRRFHTATGQEEFFYPVWTARLSSFLPAEKEPKNETVDTDDLGGSSKRSSAQGFPLGEICRQIGLGPEWTRRMDRRPLGCFRTPFDVFVKLLTDANRRVVVIVDPIEEFIKAPRLPWDSALHQAGKDRSGRCFWILVGTDPNLLTLLFARRPDGAELDDLHWRASRVGE